MAKYFKQNDKIFVSPDGAKEILDHLPPAVWILNKDPLIGFFLEKNADFSIPEKIFGDSQQRAERVLKTYFHRNCNTGVLLSGDKGSGKTMFARLLSINGIKHNIPTIVINNNFDNDINLNKFLSDINDRCIILFDEFEKVFDKEDNQDHILTLFDGTFQSNKLFILTANNLFKISNFILNRPGRVYYHFRYSGVEENFVREYCDYHLDNKSHTDSFVRLAKMIGKFNFDMLQALVQECNIHNDSPMDNYKLMNIDLDSGSEKFSYVLTDNKGKKHSGYIQTTIYSSFAIYTDGDKDNEDDEYIFDNKDIVKFDVNTGVFVYAKDDVIVELKREVVNRMFLDF